MTSNTKNPLDPNDPRGWPDSRLISALEPVRAATPELAEYMRRVQFRLDRQKNLMRVAVDLLRQRHVAVIDLEATCYDNPADEEAHAHEVIEVGWALLDIASLSVVDRRQFYVRPTTSFVSNYCTELTGIRPEQVAQAPSFAETMATLGALHAQYERGPVSIWGSFGEYDRRQLERQCAAEGVAYPLPTNRHFCLKEASGAYFGFGKKNPGLMRALGLAGLQFEGKHHSGVDDAVNAARVLAHILSVPIA